MLPDEFLLLKSDKLNKCLINPGNIAPVIANHDGIKGAFYYIIQKIPCLGYFFFRFPALGGIAQNAERSRGNTIPVEEKHNGNIYRDYLAAPVKHIVFPVDHPLLTYKLRHFGLGILQIFPADFYVLAAGQFIAALGKHGKIPRELAVHLIHAAADHVKKCLVDPINDSLGVAYDNGIKRAVKFYRLQNSDAMESLQDCWIINLLHEKKRRI